MEKEKESWQYIIAKELGDLHQQNSYRQLRCVENVQDVKMDLEGRQVVNFNSNDYLSLKQDSRITLEGVRLAQAWGSGSGSSRLVCGNLQIFTELERQIASWIGKESCLLYNSGYQANVGVIAGLCSGQNATIYCDKTNHASIYDGIMLSKAAFVRYRHNDMTDLELKIKKNKRKLSVIVSDALFSMDGDFALLSDLVAIKKKYRALLVLDEAHSLGLFGYQGAGLTAALDLQDQVDIIIGTMGKAFGVFGAFVATHLDITRYLVNKSRALIYSTALPPFVIGAISKALQIIRTEQRASRVLKMAQIFRNQLQANCINSGNSQSQIIPVIVGDNVSAMQLSQYLNQNGLFCAAIRPPTVPRGLARIRISLCYGHENGHIEALLDCILRFFEKRR